MTSGHLVSNRNLAFGCHINFDHLDNPWIDVFSRLQALHFHFLLVGQLIELLFVARDDFTDFNPDRTWIDFNVVVDVSNFPQQRLGDLTVRRNDNFTSLRIDYVEWDFFIQQNVR